MKYFILFFLLILSVRILPQTYSISGTVTDLDGKGLNRANVLIMNTPIGMAADSNGNYIFKGIKPGQYTLCFSMVGYEKKCVQVDVTDANISVDVDLDLWHMDDVVETTTKYNQRTSDITVSSVIIEGKDIDGKNYLSVDDALRYVPGVNMTYDQVSIRGSSGYSRGAGSRVLMTLNGVPFLTGDTGEIIWDMIPANLIQRIDVIKGAESALYGSSAIGGTINIWTKSITEEPQTYVKTLYGIYDKPAYDEWDWSDKLRAFNGITVSHSRIIGRTFGFAAALTRLENDGYKESGDYKRYLGYFQGTFYFYAAKLSFTFNSINQRNGNFLYWKDSRNALVPPDNSRGQRNETNRYFFNTNLNYTFSASSFMSINGSIYNTDWKAGTESNDQSKTNLLRGEVQFTNGVEIFGNSMVVTSGVTGSSSNVKSNIFGNRHSYNFGIYAQGEYSFSEPLKMVGGLRFDVDKIDSLNNFNNLSPKIGINYNVRNKYMLHAFIGTAFRAPSLAEVFTSTSVSGLQVKPNLTLKPERGFSLEAGCLFNITKNIDIDASIFRNEYYDYIEAGIDPSDQKIIFGNVTRARIQGFELVNSYSFFKDKLKFTAGYTYLWSRDLNLHKALKYRPRHMLYVNSSYNFGSFEVGADFRGWSRVEEIDNEITSFITDAQLRVPVYVFDFNTSYNFLQLGLPLKANFSVKNITNYNYVELFANLAPLRNYSLSLELLF